MYEITAEKAREELLQVLKPGDTVYTILRHVSQSGMMRHIDVIVLGHGRVLPSEDIRPLYYNYAVSKILGRKRTDSGSLKVGGCGMDMGFSIVYGMGRALWPDGFDCIGKNCPANDHANGDDVAHHEDGGYALRQQWL